MMNEALNQKKNLRKILTEKRNLIKKISAGGKSEFYW